MKERLKWPIKATGTSIRQICKASSRGQLGHLVPRKGKNMNDFNTETPVGEAIVDVRHFIIDADGNRIEVPFDASNGETAPAETTVFVAEDYSDTRVEPVTVH